MHSSSAPCRKGDDCSKIFSVVTKTFPLKSHLDYQVCSKQMWLKGQNQPGGSHGLVLTMLNINWNKEWLWPRTPVVCGFPSSPTGNVALSSRRIIKHYFWNFTAKCFKYLHCTAAYFPSGWWLWMYGDHLVKTIILASQLMVLEYHLTNGSSLAPVVLLQR